MKEDTLELWKHWHKLNAIYEEYAKSVGMNYTSLLILNLISMEGDRGCAQKQMAEQIFIPKQTINNVITGFYRQGYVELHENENDRREKTVRLTDAGKKYAAEMIPVLDAALDQAMDQFTEDEKQLFFSLMKRYVDVCDKNVKR